MPGCGPDTGGEPAAAVGSCVAEAPTSSGTSSGAEQPPEAYARLVHVLEAREPRGWLEHELELHGAKPQLRIFASSAPTSAGGSPRATQPPSAAGSEAAPPPPTTLQEG